LAVPSACKVAAQSALMADTLDHQYREFCLTGHHPMVAAAGKPKSPGASIGCISPDHKAG
jgi:hypothetical protein